VRWMTLSSIKRVRLKRSFWLWAGSGLMGMGEKLVALPFKPLKIIDLGIIYNIATQQLNNLPEFSLGKSRQN